MPTFPLGRAAGAAVLGGLKIPHSQQSPHQEGSLHTKTGPNSLHTKTGPRKVGDVVTPPGPWSISEICCFAIAVTSQWSKVQWEINSWPFLPSVWFVGRVSDRHSSSSLFMLGAKGH